MIRKVCVVLVFLILVFCPIDAQQKQDSVVRVSLEEAKAFALQNSPVMKNAGLDLESARKRIWEVSSAWLPQANGKASYSYMITVPAFIEQFTSFTSMPAALYNFQENIKRLDPAGMFYNYAGSGPAFPLPQQYQMPNPGTPKPMNIDDLRWNLTFDLTVSQVIYSRALQVGIQTTKVLKDLSDLMVSKSEKDLKEAVTNAYFLVLVSQENRQMVDTTYQNTEKIAQQIEAMHKQGLNDETDVDQLRLTLSTIKNMKEMLERQVEISKNLLRFQMGIDLSVPIELSDNLAVLSAKLENESLALQEFHVENITEYKLADMQVKLALKNLQSARATVFPDVAGFFSHQDYLNKKAFVLTPPNMVGVGMNIPIFGSGMRYAKISQAKIGLMKAQNAKFQASEGLKMGYADARSGYINSLNKYHTNKDNLKLSEKIYRRTLEKYRQGMVSSLELTQAQNQYLQSQSNYYISIFELVSAQNKLEKYIGEK